MIIILLYPYFSDKKHLTWHSVKTEDSYKRLPFIESRGRIVITETNSLIKEN